MSDYAECPKCYGPGIRGVCKDCGHDPETEVRAALRGLVEAAKALQRAADACQSMPVPMWAPLNEMRDAVRAAESAMGGERHG